jgi:hypothetical protein
VRTVIIAFTWWQDRLVDRIGRAIDNRDDAALVTALDDLDERLQHAGKRIILVGPIAYPGWDVSSVLSRELAYGWPADRPDYLPAATFSQRFNATIKHFEGREGVTFVPAYDTQCAGARCAYVMDGCSLHADDRHIAAGELWRFQPLFAAAFRQSASLAAGPPS